MKNLEIPKAVLDLLDYDMMPEGMHEQMEKRVCRNEDRRGLLGR